MRKRLSLLLISLLVLGVSGSVSYGVTNPLKSYNLYEDVNRNNNKDRENVMEEFYANSLKSKQAESSAKSSSQVPSESASFTDTKKTTEEKKESRNEYLRKSSKEVFADKSKPAGWLDAPSFYKNPNINSIILKYRKSNFTGCLQEAISLVKKQPNNTLGYYYMAMSYAKAGDKENAVKAYEKVISLNSNPMIVKYATNGRNCVLEKGESAKCFEDVNVPELKYPYADLAKETDELIDTQALINKKMGEIQGKVAPDIQKAVNGGKGENGEGAGDIKLPFGNQDDELDKFINSPYGNGFSEELNTEQKKMKLKYLKDIINKEQDGSDAYFKNFNNIKDFDRQKSDNNTIKLAYDASFDIEKLKNDPQFIKNQKEIDEINMLFGNSKKDEKDFTQLLMTEQKNLSPEVIKTMMMQSVMSDIINTGSTGLL